MSFRIAMQACLSPPSRAFSAVLNDAHGSSAWLGCAHSSKGMSPKSVSTFLKRHVAEECVAYPRPSFHRCFLLEPIDHFSVSFLRLHFNAKWANRFYLEQHATSQACTSG